MLRSRTKFAAWRASDFSGICTSDHRHTVRSIDLEYQDVTSIVSAQDPMYKIYSALVGVGVFISFHCVMLIYYCDRYIQL